MLAQLANEELALGHEMVDYRHKESALAQLIDAKTSGLAACVPSDPPADDDGGQGVAAWSKPNSPGLPGREPPPRSSDREWFGAIACRRARMDSRSIAAVRSHLPEPG
jgi:hypothetical protein